MALVWKTSEEENNSTEVKEAPPGLFSISLYVALQDSLCVWCALALACVASEVCCHKYFFVLTVYISTFNYYVELHFQEGVGRLGLFEINWYECLLIILACESSHVCTVCIWHCEHARVCMEVFMRHIYIFSPFIAKGGLHELSEEIVSALGNHFYVKFQNCKTIHWKMKS